MMNHIMLIMWHNLVISIRKIGENSRAIHKKGCTKETENKSFYIGLLFVPFFRQSIDYFSVFWYCIKHQYWKNFQFIINLHHIISIMWFFTLCGSVTGRVALWRDSFLFPETDKMHTVKLPDMLAPTLHCINPRRIYTGMSQYVSKTG